SEFVVVLPARAPAGEAVARAPALVVTPAGQKRRVLVVDDNVDAAESLAMIVKLWGHEVAVAHDGRSALEECARWVPDVVLLDIGMPAMTGHEVARRLRERPEHAGTLLVALTGWGAEQDRQRS